ncbi:MAG: hypothetical protein ACFCUI_05300 [Bernardetiaceae bacterium]
MGFHLRLLLFTGVLLAVLAMVSWWQPAWVHQHAVWVIVYCASLTWATFALTSSKAGTKDFPNAVLGATAIRLFLSATALMIHLYLFKEHRLVFILTFFISYFLFIGFEIKILLHTLQRKT